MNRFLFALSLSLTATLFAACSDSSEGQLRKARVSFEKEDYPAAVIHLKNVLREDGQNGEARRLLGEAYFQLGDIPGAEKELTRAISSGVAEADVAPLLAQVLLVMAEYERLAAISGAGLDSVSASTVHAAQAMAMAEQGEIADASRAVEEVLQGDAVSPFSLTVGARIAMMEQSMLKARKRLDRALALEPDYAPAWSSLGDIEQRERHLEEAEAAYSRALQLSPDVFGVRLKRAMVRIYRGDYEAAQQDVDVLKKASDKHPGVHFAQGIIRFHNRDLDEARASFDVAALSGDAYPLTFYYLAAIHWSKGNYELARRNINQFLAVLPDHAPGRKLAATIELQEKNFASAEELLRPVVAFYPEDVAALNMLATALLAQGETTEGIEMLSDVAKLNPESPEAQARLGAAFLAAGDENSGLEILQDTLEMDPQYQQADILVVTNHLRQGEFEAAARAAESYRDRNPGSVAPYNLLGRIYLGQGDVEQAKAAFDKALDISPGNPLASHSLADIALREKNFDAARDYYQQVLKHNPDHLQTQLKIAASYALEEKRELMRNALEGAMKAHPEAIEPRLILSKYYITRGEPERVQALIDGLGSAKRALPEVLATLAASQIAQRNFNQGLATADKLLALKPDTGHYHYLKAQALAGTGDLDKALAELERAVELAPDHFSARVSLARLYLMKNKPELFSRQLAELKRRNAGERTEVLQLEVASARAGGDQARATQLLETLFERNPTTTSVINLGVQRRLEDDIGGGIALLERWVAGHPDDIKSREALADFYSNNNQMEQAADQYAEIIERDGKNALALNNLAWLLSDKDPVRALSLARSAVELVPNSASMLDTLAVVQLKNNRLADAGRTIERALLLSPDNASMRFHKAQIQAASGDVEEAVITLDELLGGDAQFSEREEAVSLLGRLRK